jgi:predicted tellurium resistance membrane protein TerC
MDNAVGIVLLTAFFLAMLVLDLGVFHHRPHEISISEAAAWTGVWVALSLAFGIGLYLALVMVEVTDVVLAMDSIPAIFSITRDPLIVYSSTMFAVLGLRSLYFLLAGVTTRLRYLHTGLAAILIFVGAKMLAGHFVEVPTVLSLGVVCGILLVAVFASLAP